MPFSISRIPFTHTHTHTQFFHRLPGHRNTWFTNHDPETHTLAPSTLPLLSLLSFFKHACTQTDRQTHTQTHTHTSERNRYCIYASRLHRGELVHTKWIGKARERWHKCSWGVSPVEFLYSQRPPLCRLTSCVCHASTHEASSSCTWPHSSPRHRQTAVWIKHTQSAVTFLASLQL